jgi:hypothetical protein
MWNSCDEFQDSDNTCKFCALCIETYTKKIRCLSPRTNYTERAPPLFGEISANFCGQKVSHGQRD